MALVVNTNVSALNTQRTLNSTTNQMQEAIGRLSSGKRINSAADDAAGLAISTRMTSQVKGLNMAIRNANDGISLVQTAEGAMDEVTNMLQRMRELSVQASNSTLNDSDRASLNDEVGQLLTEIDRVANTTRFNNQVILDGSYAANLQIGDQADQSMSVGISSANIASMGETADGLASAASAASLSVGGISTSAADYQGKTFQVTSNGVTTTVTLPTAAETTATAASATATLQGEDLGAATSSVISTDSYRQATIDLTDAVNRVIQVRGAGDSFVNVDFSQELADYYGVTVNALDTPSLDTASLSEQVTSDVLVTVMNQALANEAALQGANAVTVSVNSVGQLEFADASGSTTNVAIREGYTVDPTTLDGTFAAEFIDSSVDADGAITARSLGIVELDMSDDKYSVFKVKVNGAVSYTTVDFLDKLNNTDYVANRDSVKAEELVNALQAELDELFTGNDAVTVSFDEEGQLNFSVAGGDRTIELAEDNYDNAGTSTAGDFVSGLVLASVTTGSTTISNSSTTKDLSGVDSLTKPFESDNYIINVRVNGGSEVNIDLQDYITDIAADTSAVTGAEMVSILQAAFDDNFSGEDAITVGQRFDGKLTFSVAKDTGVLLMSEADTNFDSTDGTFVTNHIDSSGSLEINQAKAAVVSTSTPVTDYGDVAYGSFVSGTPIELVDFANQKETTRLTPFDDISSHAVTLDGDGGNGTAITWAIGDIVSFVLDDGVKSTTITATLTAASLANAVTLLGSAVTSTTSSDADAVAGRYSFSASGNDLVVTHKDGRTFTVAAGSTHAIGTGDFDYQSLYGTAVDSTLSTTAASVEPNTAADISIAAGSTLAITLEGASVGTVTIDAGEYRTLEDVAASIQYELDAHGAFQGENALIARVVSYTDETAPAGSGQLKYLAIESAYGKEIEITETTSSLLGSETNSLINATKIFQEYGVEPDETNYRTHARVDGGVDTTAGSGLVNLSVTDGANSYVYQLSMAQDANTSFASFTADLEAKANAAMAAHGISFSVNTSGTNVSIDMDQAGDYSFSLSGDIVDDAFGGSVSASGAPAGAVLNSMDDVVSEIAADLSATGVSVNYDADTNEIVFADNSGTTGTSSTVSLAGSDLASMQFAGTLSAAGVASDATASKLSEVDVSTEAGATSALASIDNAIEYISSQRSELGAVENRLNHTVSNLSNVVNNTAAARSRIEDADFAVESANLAKMQVMQQAGTAMLAQANASAQLVLSLLG